jgi:hypothetical protein
MKKKYVKIIIYFWFTNILLLIVVVNINLSKMTLYNSSNLEEADSSMLTPQFGQYIRLI